MEGETMADYVKELRNLIGSKPVILCGAGVTIINSKGEILLQRRIDNDLWGCAGGAVEMGETVEEAAIREAYEETGLRIRNLKLLGVYSGKKTYYKYPNGDEVFWVSVAFTSNDFDGDIRPDNVESKDCRFFKIDELPENIFYIDTLAIDDYLKSIGK